jgi:hypothetical protein
LTVPCIPLFGVIDVKAGSPSLDTVNGTALLVPAAVVCWNDGTEQLVCEAFGELLPDVPEREIPGRLKEAIQRMLDNPEERRTKGRQAQRFAEANPFSKTADYLIDLCLSSSGTLRSDCGR